MRVIFTRHAEDKLREKEAKKFKITKTKLRFVIKKPKVVEQLPLVKRAVGTLDEGHSLCVIYKFEEDAIKVITFFPTEVGRYES